MNRPIKIKSKIKDPKSLLNKFIIFKYKNGFLSIYYINKIEGTKLFTCNAYNNNSKKVSHFEFFEFPFESLNEDIKDSLKNNPYNVYTI